MSDNPYDELAYRSLPIAWSAPERLALTSLLHAGPRLGLGGYRVLELGCGDGSNLLPLAYYRPHATFVGVDAAARAIATAEARRSDLALANLRFVHANFGTAALEGTFDVILAHGVFSWVPQVERDRLLALVARHLAPAGLFYVNYNTRPGWDIRGLVRDFLRAQTSGLSPLRARAERAQAIAGQGAAALGAAPEHPYTRLLERELTFVAGGHVSYVAHEFLAEDNHAYWRSEFLALAAAHGLSYVADADFDQSSARLPPDLAARVAATFGGGAVEDTVDLFCYRQLHSPLLTTAGWQSRPATPDELGALLVASRLAPAPDPSGEHRLFRHANGFEVEARDPIMATALLRLESSWPAALPLATLVPDVMAAVEDVRLLYQHGMLELHLPAPPAPPPDALNQRERAWGGYTTTAQHTFEIVEQ